MKEHAARLAQTTHRARPLAGAADLEERQCRICFDSSEPETLIAPCSCAGTQRWIHRGCLDEWRAQERLPRAFTHCPTCKFEYQTELHDAPSQSCLFRCYVLRDTVGLFAAAQSVLALVGYSIHACDSEGNVKRLYPGQWAERTADLHLSVGPYYVTAVIVCLALLGIVGFWMQRTGRLQPPPPRAAAVRRHSPASSCGGGGCDGTDGFMCCDPGCHSCGQACGSAECGGTACEGCNCAGGSGCVACEGEGAAVLLPVLAVVLILLAIVGLFFLIFFATIVVQRIVQRHMHLLQMRSETQRVVVVNLADRSQRRSSGDVGLGPMSMQGLASRV